MSKPRIATTVSNSISVKPVASRSAAGDDRIWPRRGCARARRLLRRRGFWKSPPGRGIDAPDRACCWRFPGCAVLSSDARELISHRQSDLMAASLAPEDDALPIRRESAGRNLDREPESLRSLIKLSNLDIDIVRPARDLNVCAIPGRGLRSKSPCRPDHRVTRSTWISLKERLKGLLKEHSTGMVWMARSPDFTEMIPVTVDSPGLGVTITLTV